MAQGNTNIPASQEEFNEALEKAKQEARDEAAKEAAEQIANLEKRYNTKPDAKGFPKLQVEDKLLQFKFCTTIRMKGGPKYEYEHFINEEKAEKDFGKSCEEILLEIYEKNPSFFIESK